MPRTAPASRLRSILRIGAPLLLVVLLAGCLLPPEPKTESGQDVFNLYLLVLGLAAIVFVGVEGFIIYAVIRYRRQPGDDVLPPQLHGNNTVEIIWTAIPTVIVFILFIFSMITLGEVEARSEDPVTIEVEGFQWQWIFRYEEGAEVIGNAEEPAVMAVPVGEPVRLVLASTDVNHAFYVPQFLIKRDVIDPGENGRPNELEFTVTEAGTYSGQCAEFCGSQHAEMTFTVEAMPRAEYDAYIAALAAGRDPSAAADGRVRHDDPGRRDPVHPVRHRLDRGARERGLLHRVHEQRQRGARYRNRGDRLQWRRRPAGRVDHVRHPGHGGRRLHLLLHDPPDHDG